MVEVGFQFEPLKINQAEPTFLTAKFLGTNFEKEHELTIKIPNFIQTTFKTAIEQLVVEAFNKGYFDGVVRGKKEVGNYLKSLTD